MTSNAESVMKNLAEVSREGERGFATAAQVVKDEKLRGILERASQRCAIGVRELEEAIVNSGGTVTDEGTISAALHRAWINLKAAIPAAMTERSWRSASGARTLQRLLISRR